MGVNMGQGTMQPADVLNPGGYYEDLRWQRINKVLAGIRYSTKESARIATRYHEEYRRLIGKCKRFDVWGFKGPRACFTLQHIWPLLKEADVETRAVVVHRSREAVIDSLQNHSRVAYNGKFKMDRSAVERLLDAWQAAMKRRLLEFDGPAHVIRFEDLLEDTIPTLLELEAFCFAGGYEEHSKGVVRAANWVNPEWVNFHGGDHHPDAGQGEGELDGGESAWAEWYPKLAPDCGRC
jgi:hypothetical protein